MNAEMLANSVDVELIYEGVKYMAQVKERREEGEGKGGEQRGMERNGEEGRRREGKEGEMRGGRKGVGRTG